VSPEWIWMAFIVAFGACVGSFLNVVIYRLPREKSLVWPGSACPSCNTPIHFYDNIPLFSWLILGGKCRVCKTSISPRYFLIELLTACLFIGVYLWYFYFEKRQMDLAGEMAIQRFVAGGWLVYLNAMILVAVFLAASAIDLELWIIPLELCWFVTAAGIIAASVSGYVLTPSQIDIHQIFPMATAKQASIAAGAGIGLIISLVCLRLGIIKPSYPYPEGHEKMSENPETEEPEFNDRREILKEIIYLIPIISGGIIGYMIVRSEAGLAMWNNWLGIPAVRGFFGALMGYFAGCTVVWATRIVGTLGFGREAMGLGDVHLMGAAGAVIGPWMAVLAFFIAPFFGLIWALYQWIFKKSRQIPYGPFLSIAVFGVMIFHDWIRNVFMNWYGF